MKYCIKCQAETVRDQRGSCKQCIKIYAANYRMANAEKIRHLKAAWRAANKSREREASAAWRAANKDRHRIMRLAWVASNKEKSKSIIASWREANKEICRTRYEERRDSGRSAAATAAYRAANPEKVKAALDAWRSANPLAIRIHSHNQRARKRVNGGKLSNGLSVKLFKLQNGKCPCCGELLGDDYHLDHIMPLALGGANEDSNIQLLKSTCNMQKHAKHPVDFMQSRGFLL